MSYARPSYSDLYIYMNMSGELECLGCIFAPTTLMHHSTGKQGVAFRAKNTLRMINHIQEHRDAGHNVPDGIEERLLEDDKENFGDVKIN